MDIWFPHPNIDYHFLQLHLHSRTCENQNGHLRIYMVLLNLSQWSTLFGELSMTFLEDIEVERDIPWPALTRFLINHKGLKRICIRGNVTSDCALSGWSQRQHFPPSLQILYAPLEICCDILE